MPSCVDDLDQFLRDVDAEAVIPAILEPLGELIAGIVVQHVDVQFAMIGQAGERQVAAAEIADRGVQRIWPKKQVQLGVQRMP